MQDADNLCGTGTMTRCNPVIGPRLSAVGRMVKQEHAGGRDVAPIGAGLRVPRALPVGLHGASCLFCVASVPRLPIVVRA